jgi:hypothetical protein
MAPGTSGPNATGAMNYLSAALRGKCLLEWKPLLDGVRNGQKMESP